MYVEEIKKRQGEKIYKTILVRESYRDKNGKVQHRTIANISKLPAEYIRQLKMKEEISILPTLKMERHMNMEVHMLLKVWRNRSVWNR